jgi:hypothetical protein
MGVLASCVSASLTLSAMSYSNISPKPRVAQCEFVPCNVAQIFRVMCFPKIYFLYLLFLTLFSCAFPFNSSMRFSSALFLFCLALYHYSSLIFSAYFSLSHTSSLFISLLFSLPLPSCLRSYLTLSSSIS